MVGKFHSEVAKADVVESYIAPQDFTINDQTVKRANKMSLDSRSDPGNRLKRRVGLFDWTVGIRQSI